MEGTEGSIRSSQVRRTVRRGTSIPNPCRSPSRARAAGTTGDPIRPGGRVQGPSRRRLCRSSERARPHPAPRPWRAPHLNKLDHRRRRQPTPDCPLRPPQSGGHLSASDTAAAPCKGQTSATASCGGSGGGGVDSSVRRGDSDRASGQGRSASFCARPGRTDGCWGGDSGVVLAGGHCCGGGAPRQGSLKKIWRLGGGCVCQSFDNT